MLPTITLEEHFISEVMSSSQSVKSLALHQFPPTVRSNLLDIGERRIKAMDESNISLQVISHVPALAPSDICQQANHQLAEAVKARPTRFAGFAFLPMGDPSAAADELERCVKELGFVGALIPNHAAGVYYDSESYTPFWQRVQQLDVPIYLHPTPASAAQREYFAGNYPDELAQLFSTQVWGWHADVAVHLLRLYASGLFDKFSKLKIVIGHMGEMLPFMVERIESRLTGNWGSMKRGFKTVWEENVWVTTSGMFYMGPFACLIRTVKKDRIMYSVDYPLEDNAKGDRFLKEVENSGWLTEEELHMFAYKNAEHLLGVKAKAV